MHKSPHTKRFHIFIQKEQSAGIVLLIFTALALLLANLPLGDQIQNLWNFRIGAERLNLNLSVLDWINDGLMTLFFLQVGLEIKRELISGELSTRKKSILPIIAAIGGMICPALIYFLFNGQTPEHVGWGIPIATDIAFSLAILSLLGKKIPLSLRIFLAALAIIDDLGSILVIATFYTKDIHLIPILLSAAIMSILLILNRFNVNNLGIFLILGPIFWYLVLQSGIHPTIAGVLFAFVIPANNSNGNSMLVKMETFLHKPVNFLIIPLFAFANTGIILSGNISENYTSLSLGILLGLFLGKPLGIVGFSYIASKLKLTSLPNFVNWKMMIGVGFLAGIGFTMAIFISVLSFQDPTPLTISKISTLVASLISGFTGFLILKKTSRPVKSI